jgi:hypothetical protein
LGLKHIETTNERSLRLIAAAPDTTRLAVLRALNPALHDELVAVTADSTQAVARLGRLSARSAVELVGYVSDPELLAVLAADSRHAVHRAVVAQACRVGAQVVARPQAPRMRRTTTERTLDALGGPVADAVRWLGATSIVDLDRLAAWCRDLTDEKIAAWPDVVAATTRLTDSHLLVLELTFANDLGADALGRTSSAHLAAALSRWDGPVNQTVLDALVMQSENWGVLTRLKGRHLSVPVPPDAPLSVRTVFARATPAELTAELTVVANDRDITSWRRNNAVCGLARLVCDTMSVEAVLPFLESDAVFSTETVAAELLRLDGLSRAQYKRLVALQDGGLVGALLSGTTHGDSELLVELFIEVLAEHPDPTVALTTALVDAASVDASCDRTWLLDRFLSALPGAARVLLDEPAAPGRRDCAEEVLAYVAERIGSCQDAWPVVVSQLHSYPGLLDDLVAAAVAAAE